MAVRGPQATLDPAILALARDPREREPPLLHYGLEIDHNVLEEYANQHALVIGGGRPITSDAQHTLFLERAVMNRLSEECKFHLELDLTFPATEGRFVIAIDDTRRLQFTQMKSTTWERRTRTVIKTLKRELGLDLRVQPMWWWNFYYNEGCVLPTSAPHYSDLRSQIHLLAGEI